MSLQSKKINGIASNSFELKETVTETVEWDRTNPRVWRQKHCQNQG